MSPHTRPHVADNASGRTSADRVQSAQILRSAHGSPGVARRDRHAATGTESLQDDGVVVADVSGAGDDEFAIR